MRPAHEGAQDHVGVLLFARRVLAPREARHQIVRREFEELRRPVLEMPPQNVGVVGVGARLEVGRLLRKIFFLGLVPGHGTRFVLAERVLREALLCFLAGRCELHHAYAPQRFARAARSVREHVALGAAHGNADAEASEGVIEIDGDAIFGRFERRNREVSEAHISLRIVSRVVRDEVKTDALRWYDDRPKTQSPQRLVRRYARYALTSNSRS